jgi:hypothetical protein
VETEFEITIQIAGRTDQYHLKQFLCGRQGDVPQETTQLLDVVLKECQPWKYNRYTHVLVLTYAWITSYRMLTIS